MTDIGSGGGGSQLRIEAALVLKDLTGQTVKKFEQRGVASAENVKDAMKRLNREADKLSKELKEAYTAATIGAKGAAKATDEFGKAAGRAGARARGAFGNANSSVGKLRTTLFDVRAILATLFVTQTLSRARDFQTEIARIGTLLDNTAAQLPGLTRELQGVIDLQGTDNVETARALYQAISAGAGQGADAIEVLNKSIQLSRVAVSDTATAVDALTSVLNAYRLEAEEADRVSALLFSTVRFGKTTLDQLGPSLGQIVPIAAELGIGLEDLFASISLITRSGASASQAITQVRSAVVNLQRFLPKINQQLKAYNVQIDESTFRSRGLGGTLQLIADAANTAGVPLQTLIGRVEGLLGILNLTGENAEAFRNEVARFSDLDGLIDEADALFRSNEGVQFTENLNKAITELTKTGQNFLIVLNDIVDVFRSTNAERRGAEVLGITPQDIREIGTLFGETGFEANRAADAIVQLGESLGATDIGPIINLVRVLSDAGQLDIGADVRPERLAAALQEGLLDAGLRKVGDEFILTVDVDGTAVEAPLNVNREEFLFQLEAVAAEGQKILRREFEGPGFFPGAELGEALTAGLRADPEVLRALGATLVADLAKGFQESEDVAGRPIIRILLEATEEAAAQASKVFARTFETLGEGADLQVTGIGGELVDPKRAAEINAQNEALQEQLAFITRILRIEAESAGGQRAKDLEAQAAALSRIQNLVGEVIQGNILPEDAEKIRAALDAAAKAAEDLRRQSDEIQQLKLDIAFAEARQEIEGTAESAAFVNQLQRELNTLLADQRLQAAEGSIYEEQARALRDLVAEGKDFEGVLRVIGEENIRLQRELDSELGKQLNAIDQKIDKQVALADIALIEARNLGFSTKEIEEQLRLLEEVRKKRREEAEGRANRGPQGAFGDEIAGLLAIEERTAAQERELQLFQEAREAQAELTRERQRYNAAILSNNVSEALKAQLKLLRQQNNLAADLANLLTNTFDSLVDSLAQLTERTQDSDEVIRQFFVGFLRELNRVIIRQLLLNSLIGGIVGGGGGGDGGGGGGNTVTAAKGAVVSGGRIGGNVSVPFRKFADGGVVNSPTLALFGEVPGKQEAFIPLEGGNVPVKIEQRVTNPGAIAAMGGDGGGRMSVGDISISVNSLDPRTAADVIRQSVPEIENEIAARLNSGANRGYTQAVGRAARRR